MRNSSKKLNGFTLTELLVMIGIFLIVMVAIYSAHVLSQRAYRESETAAEITQNGRVILERMVREIRQAKEIVTELYYDETGATSTLEFEDGHTPILSRYQGLGSDHYYIRYYIPTSTNELRRQYRVYCFDDCQFDNCQPQSDVCTNVCSSYHRWNSTQEITPTSTHPCVLEDKTIGEYVVGLEFWDLPVINTSITLEKNQKRINLRTKIFGRNL